MPLDYTHAGVYEQQSPGAFAPTVPTSSPPLGLFNFLTRVINPSTDHVHAECKGIGVVDLETEQQDQQIGGLEWDICHVEVMAVPTSNRYEGLQAGGEEEHENEEKHDETIKLAGFVGGFCVIALPRGGGRECRCGGRPGS